MRKILLIQQYLGNNVETGPIFPIGLAYIATAIRSKTNWEIKVLDLNITEKPYETLNSIILEYKPDVIGISLRNIDNVDLEHFYYYYGNFINLIDCLSIQEAILVVGGAGFSIFADEIMQQNPSIDYGIVHEGEETFVELLQAIANSHDVSDISGLIYRNGNRIIHNKQRTPLDFSKSAIPDRSFFEMDAYNKPLCLGVQTKRGCSLKCSYCTYPFLSFHGERFRSINSIVDEIQLLVNEYKINEIIFCDDIFNVPKKHAEDIIREIIRRKITIRWSAWFDIANTDEEFIQLAIESGCYRFCFSVEGIINSSLQALRKNFTIEQIYKLLKIVEKKKYKDIDFRFSIFAVPPCQTILGMLRTLLFVYRTHVKHENIKCLVSWIRIYPFTPLYEEMKNSPTELLPYPSVKINKSALFWDEHAFSSNIIKFYQSVLSILNSIRRFKRKYIW